MAIDCTQIPRAGKVFGNDVLCDGLNQIIQGQDTLYQLLSSSQSLLNALNDFLSVFTADTVYFFLGVICAVIFIQGIKMRL